MLGELLLVMPFTASEANVINTVIKKAKGLNRAGCPHGRWEKGGPPLLTFPPSWPSLDVQAVVPPRGMRDGGFRLASLLYDSWGREWVSRWGDV